MAGVRQWLKDNGYAANDNEITYDKGTVYLKGRKFMDATPAADGSTYADEGALGNAMKGYKQTGLMNEVTDALGKYKTMVLQPREQFSYDPQKDPQYQNALVQAQKNATTATNNTMVGLGSRGIGNSSVAVDRANQIQQSAVGDVTANVLPELMKQAYNRYVTDQNFKQQDLQNTGKYLDFADNLYTQGENSDRQKQQDHINLANDLTNTYGVAVQPKDDPYYAYKQVEGLTPLSARQTDQSMAIQEAGVTGVYKGQPTMQSLRQNADIENIRADNARLSNATAAQPNVTQETAGKANTYISNLNNMYTSTDPDTKQTVVNNPDGLERAILSLNLPSDQTMYLYRYYGLKIPQ